MRGFSLHYMNGEKAAFSFQAEMVDFGAIAVSCKQKKIKGHVLLFFQARLFTLTFCPAKQLFPSSVFPINKMISSSKTQQTARAVRR